MIACNTIESATKHIDSHGLFIEQQEFYINNHKILYFSILGLIPRAFLKILKLVIMKWVCFFFMNTIKLIQLSSHLQHKSRLLLNFLL